MAQISSTMTRSGVDIRSVGPVLQELRYLDRTLYKATEKGLKDAAKPLVNDVRQAFPNKILSGMMVQAKSSSRKRGPYPVYRAGQVRRQVNSKVGGRRRSSLEAFPVLKITQRNGAAMIFDMAQHQQTPGNTLVANLKNAQYGNASRVMWPTVRKNVHKIEGALLIELEKAQRMVVARTGGLGVSSYRAASVRASSQARTALGRFGAA